MDDIERPDPDEILARIYASDKQQELGKLKIFLGYAAGVGKTYAMLEAAHQRIAEGVDVVAACVETHGRTETEALLKGLETIPRRTVKYKNTEISEMDIDAILERKPHIVLVDELAHTNAPGSRHPKRYLDVKELLEHGVDVYTTLNIQHLESLVDAVEQITGVRVRETIPNQFLEGLVEIELIDLPPDELMQRLKEGKVYIPEQAARAIKMFFRKGNLTALREMTMRQAAQKVDDQMLGYMETRSILGPWPAGERIMVCISSHPLSERLVRAGRRMAEQLNAPWFVVYVETSGHMHGISDYQERLFRTLRLAEELGATFQKLIGMSIPEAVVDFAKKHNITKIIVGKPLRSRWQEIVSGSIVDKIIQLSGSIDVYVMSSESGPIQKGIFPPLRFKSPLIRYLEGIILVLVITLIMYPMQYSLNPANLFMPYLVGVVLASIFLGRGPSILASLISVLTYDFFFVDPHLSFSVSDTEYILTFLGLIIVGLVISNLSGQAREQMDALRQSETQILTLYNLSQELTSSRDLDAVLQKVIEQISNEFSREVVILLSGEHNLEMRASSPQFNLDEKEIAVANWSYEHGQPAGRGTDTLPAANIRYQPLKTAHGIVGVLGVKPGDPSRYLTPEQRRLLDAYASLAAIAIERARLSDQANQIKLLDASEKLQTALLNSISHELRTPLVTIQGVMSSLLEETKGHTRPMDAEGRLDLLTAGLDEAERLNRLVANLLDMSRLESGVIHLSLHRSDIEEIIGSALAHLAEKIKDRPVETNIPDDLPMVKVDYVLMEQVFINILDNAIKYSPPELPIKIDVEVQSSSLRVSVEDRGAGIPEADLERVFDKFYRVQQPNLVTGTGLGLSICKGIIEAHGGKIWAANLEKGGMAISFTIPFDNEGHGGVVSTI